MNDEATAVGSLLAVMLGDGGHRQAEVGTVQACQEAKARYYELIEKADTAKFERDKLREERDELRATLVRLDHDLSGLRGDLDLARYLCEAVERWTGHGTYPEDAVLIGDIREAAAVLRDALDGRA